MSNILTFAWIKRRWNKKISRKKDVLRLISDTCFFSYKKISQPDSKNIFNGTYSEILKRVLPIFIDGENIGYTLYMFYYVLYQNVNFRLNICLVG